MFNYNKDYETRDTFLFGGYNKDLYRFGGTCGIDNISATDIKYLMDMKFIDPDECQNYSPSTKEIYDFINKHPQFYAFGYAVSPERDDYRITLEGIRSDDEDLGVEDLKDFIEFAHRADELDVRPPRAWWD